MALILSGTDGLSDVDGSAATPAIRGTDANTGIFFPAADTIAFSEGGVEYMRVDSSGSLLVGQSTAATSARGLTVNGSQQSVVIRSGVDNYNELGVWTGTADGVKAQVQANQAGSVLFGARTNHPVRFTTNDTERFQIGTAGQFGIGGATYGTAGQVFTSGGSGAAPTWASPSAGALVFISSQTVTSAVASVDFTSGISSTYDDYVVYFSDVTPVNNSVNMRLRLYKSGAFQSTGYATSSASFKTTSALQSSDANTYIYMSDNTISNTVSVINGSCTFFNMNSALGNRATAVGQLFFNVSSSTAQSTTIFGGNQSTAATTTGMQFFFSSGNVNSGTFRLYGVAKS